MFSSIKTSALNREVVVDLTRKFNLGAENVIARVAIAYSLKSGVKFDPMDVKDSGGKEYSRGVLFGGNDFLYIAMMCTYYGISENDKDLSRYFKLHLDDGLERIAKDVKANPNLLGFDYLFDHIQEGLEEIC